MKRTLTLFLLCAVASCALAQTPKVVEKTVAPVKDAKAAHDKQVAAVSAQTPAAKVKVVAVTASPKPSAAVAKPAGKPAVIAVKPVAKPVVAAVPARAVTAQKSAPAPSKPATVAVVPAKPATAPVHAVAVKAMPQAAKPAGATKAVVAVKPVAPAAKASDPFNKKKSQSGTKAAPVVAKTPEKGKTGNVVAVNENKPLEEKKPEPKKISAEARRDPFVSPVVRLGSTGSGCSSGKRCLAIDQIALKGIVRSENGMIAVVVNSMDKAYFLRENDPVFNGYVTKITPDSVIFKETFRDRLGKEMTRDVTKTISRPAA